MCRRQGPSTTSRRGSCRPSRAYSFQASDPERRPAGPTPIQKELLSRKLSLNRTLWGRAVPCLHRGGESNPKNGVRPNVGIRRRRILNCRCLKEAHCRYDGGTRRFGREAQRNRSLNNRRRDQFMRACRSLFMVMARGRSSGDRCASGSALHAHQGDNDRDHQPQHSSSRLTSGRFLSSFIRRISPFAGLRNFSPKYRFMLDDK